MATTNTVEPAAQRTAEDAERICIESRYLG